MNKQRRKQIESVHDRLMEAQADIEEIKDEEESAYDNLPEGIQCSEKGDAMQEAIDYMDSAIDNIQDAIDNISEAVCL